MFVDDGVEGEPVPPAGGKVAHVDVRVAGCLHLAPQQQRVLCRLGLGAVGLFNCDVLDL